MTLLARVSTGCGVPQKVKLRGDAPITLLLQASDHGRLVFWCMPCTMSKDEGRFGTHGGVFIWEVGGLTLSQNRNQVSKSLSLGMHIDVRCPNPDRGYDMHLDKSTNICELTVKLTKSRATV